MRPDETQLMRAAERALERCGLPVRVEGRFVEDAPDVTDIWFDGDDEDWPDVLISYVRGAEDVRIIMGDFIFDSVPYDAIPPFIQKIFLGDYDFTASKILFGWRRSMTVEVAGQNMPPQPVRAGTRPSIPGKMRPYVGRSTLGGGWIEAGPLRRHCGVVLRFTAAV
jgi:hypothetical protein